MEELLKRIEEKLQFPDGNEVLLKCNKVNWFAGGCKPVAVP